jgi:hypothetical protein
MQYTDGQQVRLGDRVRLGSDSGGVVVCVIDTGEYTDRCPEKNWSYLKKGVVIEFPTFGLIHYEELEPDISLVERASSH